MARSRSRRSIVRYPVYKYSVEVDKPSGYKRGFLTGYVLTRGCLPQYHKLIDLHVGERHMISRI